VLLVCRNLGSFALRVNLTHKLGRAEQRKRNWSGAAIFFIIAHTLGNLRLMTQRLTKSTVDGPYKQFIHTGLWII